MTFSWDLNVVAVVMLLVVMVVQGVSLVVFFVKTSGLAKAAHDLADKAERRASEAHLAVDVTVREFGETVAAIKEKLNLEVVALRKEITDDQKYIRDMFVRRDSFFEITNQLHHEMRELVKTIDLKLTRIEEKIERRQDA